MIFGIDIFAFMPFGGGMLGYQLPWYEVCETESTWTEIEPLDLDIVRCDHAN